MSVIDKKIKLEKNLESKINRLLSKKRFQWDLEELLRSNIKFPENEYPSKKIIGKIR